MRDAPKHHVAFDDLLKGKLHPIGTEQGLALAQTKRQEVNPSRDPIVESAVVLKQVVDDPRRSRAAHYQHQVILSGSPPIPNEYLTKKDKAHFSKDKAYWTNGFTSITSVIFLVRRQAIKH